VGCGYVAGLYLLTLPLHPELELVGVTDKDEDRARSMAYRSGTMRYRGLDELLSDDAVELVVNLTNPGAHHAVSRAALEAGRHVYSEKPLALDVAEASALVELAAERGLHLSCAPSSLLGETAQTLWRAVRTGEVGTVRLVYAELDDGPLHRMNFKSWIDDAGVPWPYRDEFEVGCTMEHAGYYLTWLVAFFGSAIRVTSFASTRMPDKVPGEPLARVAPDFSVACIEFESGVVARLTNGIIAPHDHSLRIIGDEGVLGTDECWDYRSPVYRRRFVTVRRRTLLSPFRSRLPLPPATVKVPRMGGSATMDFCRGVAELASAVAEGRTSRLSPSLALHVNELTLAIDGTLSGNGVTALQTRVDPVEPL
jgi:predicted dehydrogenase